eukprot:1923894-Pleurochrysis_carterae.AAC.1
MQQRKHVALLYLARSKWMTARTHARRRGSKVHAAPHARAHARTHARAQATASRHAGTRPM